MAPPTSAPSRPGLAVAAAAGSALVVVLVLVQAIMAGQSLFEGFDIRIHGFVGSGSFAVACITALLALLARAGRPVVVLSLVNAGLLFWQVGLGYIGRDSASVAAWHVPLGVTIFGLTCVQAVLAGMAARRRPVPTPPPAAA